MAMEQSRTQPINHFTFLTNGRRVATLTVEQTAIKDVRNKLSAMFAVARGDNSVVLEWDTNPSDDLVAHVKKRVPYDRNGPPDASYGQDYASLWEPNEHGDNHGIAELPRELARYWPKHTVWDGFHLRWIKILGKGGFGYATLWEASFEDGTTKKVVIKIPNPGASGDIADELAWHEKYFGASHTVQALNLNHFVMHKRNSGATDGRPRISGPTFHAPTLNAMTLEYAEHGNLFDLLAKGSYLGAVYSNKMLWMLWECLVRGVASVSRQNSLMRENLEPGALFGVDQLLDYVEQGSDYWALELLDGAPDSHNVLFDLEEQNVLVGADERHRGNPILKLHDFGGSYCHDMLEQWKTWRFRHYLCARGPPKMNRRLPEQASKDWDDYDCLNSPSAANFWGPNLDRGSQVAGRYGTWSNIFLIGSLMESVIADRWITHPFTTVSYTNIEGDKAGQTYGHRLMRNDCSSVEPQLRDVVMRCQYEKPADRPTITQLVEECLKRRKKGFPEEEDEHTKQFWATFWKPPGEGDEAGYELGGAPGPAPAAAPAPAQAPGGSQTSRGDRGKGRAVDDLPIDYEKEPAPAKSAKEHVPGSSQGNWSRVKGLVASLARDGSDQKGQQEEQAGPSRPGNAAKDAAAHDSGDESDDSIILGRIGRRRMGQGPRPASKAARSGGPQGDGVRKSTSSRTQRRRQLRHRLQQQLGSASGAGKSLAMLNLSSRASRLQKSLDRERSSNAAAAAGSPASARTGQGGFAPMVRSDEGPERDRTAPARRGGRSA
ncbi:hypothetical protein O9K51_04238 [Purpureocillium lavendulum]|uniref:Protein kinase domain-containing protein n=1 Tax=Purpureocillium lavendulum TaxID=1247861 RepID=A0AB34FW03_9HYPO|nr:hypothetical protein O9K51_04238 [Purpureocillium lavendulum]